MSDHEGFEMLDETFGVRSESESSELNSPQPTSSSPPTTTPALQLQQGDTGSPSNHDALHLGRAGVGIEDGSAQKTVGHAPNDSMMAISPQQARRGGGTDLKNDAQLKSKTDASRDRFRPTDRASAEQNPVAELSASKNPRSRSPAKIKRNDGGENQSSVIPSTISSAGGAGASRTKPSSLSTTRDACLCIPADENKAAGHNDFPFASTTAMEEDTGTPGDAPVVDHHRTNADPPLPSVPPIAPAASALFGTFPTACTAARAPPSCHFPLAPLAALETPIDPRAAGTAAPLPPPIGRQQQQQQQQRQSSVGVAGAAATSIDGLVPTTSRGLPPPASSASAEDEAAVVELVGMGFDREHVVRALQECGRGESWKEAAISLLLEPQTSMTPESGLNGGGRPEAAGQG